MTQLVLIKELIRGTFTPINTHSPHPHMHYLTTTTLLDLGLDFKSSFQVTQLARFCFIKVPEYHSIIMGNCVETCIHSQEEERKQEEQQEQEDQKAGGFVKEGGMRIKIVLTKEELEWLLFQLENKGGKKLEDVLGEIERGRGKVAGWKPSLESIMESPELLEMDR